ncbi:hypothetical protein PPERSA_08944 [Pseudocohnilembus persalinus]|uniref:CRC domain-containing protein n=1 Tax=Pseudocohnilembus persalinus TaxID=266149 RepID=A0A0V0R3Q8_PSEPJ|nr:hypothetical protein PPERSA_08944 [Pseudocohnilembus persalinus]|eukprot:KRX08840.1 hypothetical protein PPERSA_08944 [Pseudocohnilembus persalinus]
MDQNNSMQQQLVFSDLSNKNNQSNQDSWLYPKQNSNIYGNQELDQTVFQNTSFVNNNSFINVQNESFRGSQFSVNKNLGFSNNQDNYNENQFNSLLSNNGNGNLQNNNEQNQFFLPENSDLKNSLNKGDVSQDNMNIQQYNNSNLEFGNQNYNNMSLISNNNNKSNILDQSKVEQKSYIDHESNKLPSEFQAFGGNFSNFPSNFSNFSNIKPQFNSAKTDLARTKIPIEKTQNNLANSQIRNTNYPRMNSDFGQHQDNQDGQEEINQVQNENENENQDQYQNQEINEQQEQDCDLSKNILKINEISEDHSTSMLSQAIIKENKQERNSNIFYPMFENNNNNQKLDDFQHDHMSNHEDQFFNHNRYSDKSHNQMFNHQFNQQMGRESFQSKQYWEENRDSLDQLYNQIGQSRFSNQNFAQEEFGRFSIQPNQQYHYSHFKEEKFSINSQFNRPSAINRPSVQSNNSNQRMSFQSFKYDQNSINSTFNGVSNRPSIQNPIKEENSQDGGSKSGTNLQYQGCTCLRTKCLKMCIDCCNNDQNEHKIQESQKQILSRNKDAFSNKVDQVQLKPHQKQQQLLQQQLQQQQLQQIKTKIEPGAIQNQQLFQLNNNSNIFNDKELQKQQLFSQSMTKSALQIQPKTEMEEQSKQVLGYKKGCNCRKTHCKKKYCECFNAGFLCHALCKCDECENKEEKNNNGMELEDTDRRQNIEIFEEQQRKRLQMESIQQLQQQKKKQFVGSELDN